MYVCVQNFSLQLICWLGLNLRWFERLFGHFRRFEKFDLRGGGFDHVDAAGGGRIAGDLVGLQLPIVVRYEVTIDRTSSLETFVAIRTLVIQCSEVTGLVVLEGSHVLQDLLTDLTG